MTTIHVDEETKKELAKIAGELQAKLKRRVDLDEALNFLIQQYRSKGKRKVFFELFTKPIEDVSFKDAYAELIAERRKDEKLA